ncbi:hypothetical protein GIB67_019551, partial [Kingdonia uniflora]
QSISNRRVCCSGLPYRYSRIAYCFGPTTNYIFFSWALNGLASNIKKPNDMYFFLGTEPFSA